MMRTMKHVPSISYLTESVCECIKQSRSLRPCVVTCAGPTMAGDDACRTDECENDGPDCIEGQGCGVQCTFLYTAWTTLFGSNVYGVNHSYVCSNAWDQALEYNPPDSEWTRNCTRSVRFMDFNNDSYLNFREYCVLGGVMFGQSYGGILRRYLGANCSDCIGMDHYNPYFG